MFNWKSSSSERTEFARILVTLLALSVVPLAVANLIFGSLTYATASKNYLTSSNASLTAVATAVDESVEGLENLISFIANDEDIISFTLAPGTEDYSRNVRIMESLNRIVGSYDFVSSVYLYSAPAGLVIASNSGVEPIGSFYDTGWIDSFNRHTLGPKRLATRTVRDRKNKSTEVVSLIANLPKGTWATTAGLVINLNKDSLFHNLDLVAAGTDAAYVMNERGFILEHTSRSKIGNCLGDGSLLWNTSKGGSGYFILKTGQERKIISYATAPFTRWIFVKEIKPNELVAFARSGLAVNFAMLALAAAAMLILSIRVSRTMYQPIRLLSDSNALIDHARPVMHDNLLHSILNCGKENREDIQSAFELLRVDFSADGFVVLVFEADKTSCAVEERIENELDTTIWEALKAEISAAFPNPEKVLTGEVDKRRLGVLVNFDPSVPECESQIRTAAQTALQRFRERSGRTATSGMGKPFADIMRASESFEEASEALAQKFFRGTDRLIAFADLNRDAAGHTAATAEFERKLTSAVKIGNPVEIREIVAEIARELSRRHPRNVGATLQVFNRIAITLMELREEYDHEERESGKRRDLYREIRELQTFEEAIAWLADACEDTSRRIKSGPKDRTNMNAMKIAAYIDANLQKRNISLVDIGDAVGLSPSYVSRVFKEVFGSNYVDYLNKSRIEKAKEYLLDGSVAVHEIADRLGFASLQTFIRVFKKYEHVSPGKYRSGGEV